MSLWEKIKNHLQPGYFRLLMKKILAKIGKNPETFLIGVIGDEGQEDTIDLLGFLLAGSTNAKICSLLGGQIKFGNEAMPIDNLRGAKELFSIQKCDYGLVGLTSKDIKEGAYSGLNIDLTLTIKIPSKEWDQTDSAKSMLSAFASFFRYLKEQPRKYGLKKSVVFSFDDENTNNIVDLADENFDVVFYSSNPEKSQKNIVVPKNILTEEGTTSFILENEPFRAPALDENGLRSTLAALAAIKVMKIEFSVVRPLLEKYNVAENVDYLNFEQKFALISGKFRDEADINRLLTLAKFVKIKREFSLLICLLTIPKSSSDALLKAEGEIAAKYCDRLFIAGNDHGEDNTKTSKIIEGLPEEIRDKRSSVLFYEAPNKEAAVRGAVRAARPQDVVILLGEIDANTIKKALRQERGGAQSIYINPKSP